MLLKDWQNIKRLKIFLKIRYNQMTNEIKNTQVK